MKTCHGKQSFYSKPYNHLKKFLQYTIKKKSQFPKVEIINATFSDYNSVKLEINNSKIWTLKILFYLTLKKKIKIKLKNILKLTKIKALQNQSY